MGVGRIFLRSLAKAFMILPLALTSSTQQATQTSDKVALGQESQKETKKVAPRVWTNDDFPSGQVVQPPSPKAKEAMPKPINGSPPDPLMENFLRMTPVERKAMITTYEEDIQGAKDKLDELRSSVPGVTDDAKLQQNYKETVRMQKISDQESHELDVLRSIPPDQPASKESEKKTDTAPTEPPAPESKTESAPPPNQP